MRPKILHVSKYQLISDVLKACAVIQETCIYALLKFASALALW